MKILITKAGRRRHASKHESCGGLCAACQFATPIWLWLLVQQ
jgi:hypothetical protein